jgi:hypothetical protein
MESKKTKATPKTARAKRVIARGIADSHSLKAAAARDPERRERKLAYSPIVTAWKPKSTIYTSYDGVTFAKVA